MFFIQSVLIPIFLPFFISIIPLCYFSFIDTEKGMKAVEAIVGSEKSNLVILLANKINLKLNYALCIILIFYIFGFIRKSNEGKVFNKKSDLYYDYCYFTFWCASKILGYKKVQLVGVPLHMQFKLVIRGTFDEIIADTFEEHYIPVEESEDKLKIKIKNKELSKKEINLFIEDTYPISNEELPDCKRNLPKICIKSRGTPGVRKKDDKLISDVKRAMYNIQKYKYQVINVYSTANPVNNLNIINSSFRFFGRTENIQVFVMQKSNGSSGIYNKQYKIPV